MAVEEDNRASIKFYKRQCLPVITWNKKHLLKQVVAITYTLQKKFFTITALEGLKVVDFQTE